jgi:anti-anti-sigma factor
MRIEVVENDSRVTIRLQGRFDAMAGSEFGKAIQTATKQQAASAIDVDFAEVEYIDSMGLGKLLLLRDFALKAGKSVTLARARPDVLRVFKIAGLARIFAIN